MKFAEYLWKHLTSEWYSQYIEYDEMKVMLAESVAEAEQLFDTTDTSGRERFFLQADERFFQFCEKEASKINTFFAEKLAEALRLLEPLKNELDMIEGRVRARRDTNTSRLSLNEMEPIGIERSHSVLITNPSRTNAFSSWLTRNSRRQGETERAGHRRINDLKLAFSEFYLMLVLLKNYQMLNSTGFRKILKKHDKLFRTTRGDEWRKAHVDTTPFHTSTRIDDLITEVETLYTDAFESGDRTRAMERLRVPPLDEKQVHIVTFRVGVFVGMLCLLIPLVIILGVTLNTSQSGKPLDWRSALHLYRSSFLIALHIIFIGINTYGWSHAGVNHVLVFEIDPRNHLTYQQLLEAGTCLMVLWFLSFIAFILSSYYDVQPFAQPLAFDVLLLLLLINPMRTFYYRSRRWLLKNIARVFLSPFYHVDFTGFWLGDQLTSLELIFFDLEFFICFYIYDVRWISSTGKPGFFCHGWSQFFLETCFILLPSWFRFAQCFRRYRDTKAKFPHLVNAGKYASGFLVSITNTLRRATNANYQQNRASNPFLYLWFIASFFGATYKLIWDFKMDCGLLDKNAGKNKCLRERLIYSSKVYYYVFMVQNVVLRYIWIINVFIYFETATGEYADIIGFAFAIVEIFRRFVWNYFRLENEHLNNCGDFRAVRDISIQTATLMASGYSKRLATMNARRNIENEHRVKRMQSMASEEQMTAISRRRRTTVVNDTFEHDTTVSRGFPALTPDTVTPDIRSNSVPLVVLNPYFARTTSN